MKDFPFLEEDCLTVGELAEVYDISPRTLRHYHEIGLFVPWRIDTQTGYRYYSHTQLPRLEVIIQMRSLGLSLKRITTMLETRNLSVFEAMLSEQIDELDERIASAIASRDSLYRQLNSCKYLRNPPEQDHIFMEFIPKRGVLTFQIDEYDFRKSYPGESPWKKGLKHIRTVLRENNVPMSYFNQVGCIIPKDKLLQDQYLCSGAFIPVSKDSPNLPQTILQSGTYVCMYRQYEAMDNVTECEALEELIHYIEENSYHIVGPYLGEVLAESPIFDYMNQNILVKLQIPVRI